MGCVWGRKRQATWRQGGRSRPAIPYNAPVQRRLIILVLFLLAGTAVNIAVAWGCLWWSPDWSRLDDFPDMVAFHTGGPYSDYWVGIRRHRAGSRIHAVIAPLPPDEIMVVEGNPPEVRTVSSGVDYSDATARELVCPNWTQLGPLTDRPDDVILAEQARGWPSLALWSSLQVFNESQRRFPSNLGLFVAGYSLDGATVPADDPARWNRTLPLRPIWPGFAVNTVFYGTILWLLFLVAPRTLRRQIRRRRGRCLKCGYDLRGNLDAGCPECG